MNRINKNERKPVEKGRVHYKEIENRMSTHDRKRDCAPLRSSLQERTGGRWDICFIAVIQAVVTLRRTRNILQKVIRFLYKLADGNA